MAEVALRIFEEASHSHNGETTKRKIDPEAPSPSQAIREDASEDRSNDAGDAEHAAETGEVDRALTQWDGIRQHGHATGV